MATPPKPVIEQRIVNNIKRILSLPCSTPPSLWVVTALPAFLNAAWTIVSPDDKEAFKHAFGKSWVCAVRQEVTDVAIETGSELGLATRVAFRIAELADTAVWWLFVAGVAEQGVFDWTSQIIKFSGCANPHNPNVGSSDEPLGAIFDRGHWSASINWAVDSGIYSPVTNTGIVVAPGQSWFLAAHLDATDIGHVPVAVSSRLVEFETGRILDEHAPPLREDGTAPATHVFWSGRNDAHAIRSYGIEYTCPEELPTHQGFPRTGYMTKWRG